MRNGTHSPNAAVEQTLDALARMVPFPGSNTDDVRKVMYLSRDQIQEVARQAGVEEEKMPVVVDVLVRNQGRLIEALLSIKQEIDGGLLYEDRVIFEKIRPILMDALDWDEGEVQYRANLVEDLGMESIDYLDIMHRIEKEFEIKIPKPIFFPEGISEAMESGELTEKHFRLLERQMPFAHAEIQILRANPGNFNLNALFTVRALVQLVKSRVKA
jgi:acyl carrier protein